MSATAAELIEFLQGLTFRSIGNEPASAKVAKRNQLIELVKNANPEALEAYKELGERSRVYLASQEAAAALVLSCEWDNLLHAEQRAQERKEKQEALTVALENLRITQEDLPAATPESLRVKFDQLRAELQAELDKVG